MRGRPTLTLIVVASLAFGGGPAAAAPPRVPPPTPVPPFGSPSPFPTALTTPEPSRRPPEVTAAAVALFDLDTGQMLFARKPAARRAIASTTKIMTALLVLESTTRNVRVTAGPEAAAQTGAVLGLADGERVRAGDLLHALMLGSANDAAVALAEHVSGSVRAFVGRMNTRASRLGLEDTRFASPNGLDDSGYSTAEDLAALTVVAYRRPGFAPLVRTKFHSVPSPEGPARRIQNRNALLWLYPDAIGVKTGYTFAAGFCLVAAARRGGVRLGAVVLGAPADAFSDAAALLDYGFERFVERTVVEPGDPFEAIEVDGVEIDVEALEELTALVERGSEIELELRSIDGLALPLEAGERVGTVVASAGGDVVGRSPAVATDDVSAPEPAPPGPEPWWRVAWEAVGGFLVTVARALFG